MPPSIVMPFLFDLLPRLLAEVDFATSVGTKCLTELAMALNYIRKSFPPDLAPAAQIAAAEAAIAARLGEDARLRMISNAFLTAQCAAPYVFLSAGARTSRFYDALVADMGAHDRSLRESTPYRRIERDYVLYQAGLRALPDWTDAPIMHDAAAAYAFDRDLAYAFTHTVFYCTDFAQVPRPDPFVKGAAMLLTAEAFGRADVDLFWECCICLMAQDLDAAELAGLQHLLAEMAEKVEPMFGAGDLMLHYHPLLVYDILHGLMVQRHGIDIDIPRFSGPGPFGPLAALRQALNGKDGPAILAAYEACAPAPWAAQMVRGRLGQLTDLAARHILFEREFLAMGRSDPQLYDAYQDQIAGLMQRLTALGVSPVHDQPAGTARGA